MGRGTFSQVLMCRDLSAAEPTEAELQAEVTELDAEAAAAAAAASSSSGGVVARQQQVAIPLKPRNLVAIKVIRDVARYRHAAEKEARILQHLAASKHHPNHPANPNRELQTARGMQQDSSSGVYGVNPLLGWFRMGGHMCLGSKHIHSFKQARPQQQQQQQLTWLYRPSAHSSLSLSLSSAPRSVRLSVFPPLGCSVYDFLRANHFRPMFPVSRHPSETSGGAYTQSARGCLRCS